jgi:hypothetical protein
LSWIRVLISDCAFRNEILFRDDIIIIIIIIMSEQRIQCPYCSKSYKHPTNVYGHVKIAHPGLKYKNSVSEVEGLDHKVDSNSKIAELKQLFINGDITATEFEKKSQMITEKAESKRDLVTLNLKKVLDRNMNYISDYLRDKFSEIELWEIEEKITQKDVRHLLRLVYKDQIRYFENEDNEPSLEYWDGRALQTRVMLPSDEIHLYTYLVDSLSKHHHEQTLGFDPINDDSEEMGFDQCKKNLEMVMKLQESIMTRGDRVSIANAFRGVVKTLILPLKLK